MNYAGRRYEGDQADAIMEAIEARRAPRRTPSEDTDPIGGIFFEMTMLGIPPSTWLDWSIDQMTLFMERLNEKRRVRNERYEAQIGVEGDKLIRFTIPLE